MVFCIPTVARGLLSRRKTQSSHNSPHAPLSGDKYADYSELDNNPRIGRPFPLQSRQHVPATHHDSSAQVPVPLHPPVRIPVNYDAIVADLSPDLAAHYRGMETSRRRNVDLRKRKAHFHQCENDGCPDVHARPISHFVDSWIDLDSVSYLDYPNVEDIIKADVDRDTLYPEDSCSNVEGPVSTTSPSAPASASFVLLAPPRIISEHECPSPPAEILRWGRVIVERDPLWHAGPPPPVVIHLPDRLQASPPTAVRTLGGTQGFPPTPLTRDDDLFPSAHVSGHQVNEQEVGPEALADTFSALSYPDDPDMPMVPSPLSAFSLHGGKPLPALPSAPTPTQGPATRDDVDVYPSPLTPYPVDLNSRSPPIIVRVSWRDPSDQSIFVPQSLIDDLAAPDATSRRHASVISFDAYPTPEATPAGLSGYIKFNATHSPVPVPDPSSSRSRRTSSEAPRITTPIPRVSTSFSTLCLGGDDPTPTDVKRWGVSEDPDTMGEWVVSGDAHVAGGGQYIKRQGADDVKGKRPIGLSITFGNVSSFLSSRWSPDSSVVVEDSSAPSGESGLMYDALAPYASMTAGIPLFASDRSSGAHSFNDNEHRGRELAESVGPDLVRGDQALREVLAVFSNLDLNSFDDSNIVKGVVRVLEELLDAERGERDNSWLFRELDRLSQGCHPTNRTSAGSSSTGVLGDAAADEGARKRARLVAATMDAMVKCDTREEERGVFEAYCAIRAGFEAASR